MEAQNEFKRVFKVIWAWEDDKEEKWLEECAAEGWHLLDVAPFVYKFRRGQPNRVIYRMDYKRTVDKDYVEYRDIFKACGWELAAEMANWHYYRISPDNAETPEIYSSDRSKAQKYRRLLTTLAPLIVIFASVFNPVFSRWLQYAGDQGFWLYDVAMILRIVILILWIYGIIRIIRKLRRLESGSKE
jgi:hypothetical protein